MKLIPNPILIKTRILLVSSVSILILFFPTGFFHELGHILVCASNGYDYVFSFGDFALNVHCSSLPDPILLYFALGGIFGMIASVSLFLSKKIRTSPGIFIGASVTAFDHFLKSIFETFTHSAYLSNFSLSIYMSALTAFFMIILLLFFSKREKFNSSYLNNKISTILKNKAKTFTQNSETFTLDETAKELTLAEIRNKECAGEKTITMIAVTRYQHDTNNFPKYVEYIKKNNLGTGAIYYGLWSDGYTVEDVEFDVLYVIHTENHDQIQEHLNKHDNMNKGKTQAMALMLLSDGTSKIIRNETIRE